MCRPSIKPAFFGAKIDQVMIQDLGITAQNIQAAPLALKCGAFFAGFLLVSCGFFAGIF
jgi:hypothetical protein